MLEVTPSLKFNSAAVEVIVVLAIDIASVSNVPSISTFPEISKLDAVIAPVTARVAPLKVRLASPLRVVPPLAVAILLSAKLVTPVIVPAESEPQDISVPSDFNT